MNSFQKLAYEIRRGQYLRKLTKLSSEEAASPEVRVIDDYGKGWGGHRIPVGAPDFRPGLFQNPKYTLSDEDDEYLLDSTHEGSLTRKDRSLAKRHGIDPRQVGSIEELRNLLESGYVRTPPMTKEDLTNMTDREVLYDYDTMHSPDLYPVTPPEGNMGLGRTYGEDSYMGPTEDYDPKAMAGMLRQLAHAKNKEEAQRIYNKAVKEHLATGGLVMS